ncbi:MAG: AtpZ/AtpI family protein [Acidobacteriota bacterium]
MAPNGERQKSYRLLAQYSAIIFILPSTVIGGYLVGRWIDDKLGSFPWATVVFVLLGSAGGFVEVFRVLTRKP